MKFQVASLFALLPVLATAQRPSNTSICDYYSMALFGSTNATSEYNLLVALVNRVVIGNTTNTTTNVKVPGILAPGMYNGTMVNLLPYFDGSLKSTNRSGVATSVNFLDDGGAVPLTMGMPANGTSSNQYRLLTHLYQFFGAVLGCSSYGMDAFPAYSGSTSMGAVHGFMALGPASNGYFIQQVGLAAASFGVAAADVQVAATALNSLFNVRCAPPTAVLPKSTPELQSICIANSCPLAPNNTCAAYKTVVSPQFVNGTNFTAPTGTNSSSGSGTGTGTGSGASGSATRNAAPMNLPAASGLFSAVVGLLGFLAL